MVLDDFREKKTGRKFGTFVTPFNIAAFILLLLSGYIVCLEYIKAPQNAHGPGLVLGLFSVGLSALLFVADRFLIKRMKYMHLLALEAFALVVFVAMLAV